MSLKPELKRAIADVLQKNGMPPIIDRQFNSIWDQFKGTQPSVLSSSDAKLKTGCDIWTNLQLALEKFGVQANYATKVVDRLKKKFGNEPSNTEIESLVWTR